MEADAWATALMSLPFKDGLKILDNTKNIGAVWLLKTNDGKKVIFKKGEFEIFDPIFDIN